MLNPNDYMGADSLKIKLASDFEIFALPESLTKIVTRCWD